jgi:hypothetical protein
VDRWVDVSRRMSLPTASVEFNFPVWSDDRNYTIARIHKSCDNRVLNPVVGEDGQNNLQRFGSYITRTY